MRAYVSTWILAAAFLGLVSAHRAEAAARSGAYSLELIGENGRELPTYQKDGRTYVLGTLGTRYSLKIHNRSNRRVELVASVDGRDVLDGKTSSWDRDGYVVEPYGEVVIDGFRLSHETVAAFRFSSVDHSYASKMGDARDVGVIGVAVFPERPPEPVAVAEPRPQPRFWKKLFGGSEDEKTCAHGETESQAGPTGSGSDDASGGAPMPTAAPEPVAEKAAMPPPASARSAPAESALLDLAKTTGAAGRIERPGLGTEFGEQRYSHVNEVQFVRASSRPANVLSLRYDDRAGLLALGIDLDPARTARLAELRLRADAAPFRENGFSEPPAGWSGR